MVLPESRTHLAIVEKPMLYIPELYIPEKKEPMVLPESRTHLAIVEKPMLYIPEIRTHGAS